MNRERRRQIRNVIKKIDGAASELENLRDDEDNARESMPENLHNSDKYSESERISDIIGDAISDLHQITSDLEEIT